MTIETLTELKNKLSKKAITVAELRTELENYDDDDLVVVGQEEFDHCNIVSLRKPNPSDLSELGVKEYREGLAIAKYDQDYQDDLSEDEAFPSIILL